MQKSIFALLLILICVISCKKTPGPSVTKTTVPKGVDSIIGSYIGTTEIVTIFDSSTGGPTQGRRVDTTMQTDSITILKINDTTFRLYLKWLKSLISDTVVYRDSNSYMITDSTFYVLRFFFYPKNDSMKFLGYSWAVSGGSGATFINTTFNGKK